MNFTLTFLWTIFETILDEEIIFYLFVFIVPLTQVWECKKVEWGWTRPTLKDIEKSEWLIKYYC